MGDWQLTVSRAMARGRPGMILADSRALSITDWWYWVVLVSKDLVIEVAGIQFRWSK